ncbi:ankyrin [Wolbachia endosymbiont of Drosophila incompta]|nr:ankyrin [Wolbachia endosymbiont of Drosophila incompta]
MTSKDRNKKTNVNHKKIFGALEGVDIKQSKFVSKINNQKEINREASPSRNIRENKINYGKSLDYVYGTKPLNDQAEDLNPFASNLQKIKPSASESEKLSWFKSAVVETKNVNALHKVIEQVLASGARVNACNDGEWSFAEYMILGTHFHRLEKSDRKKIMRKLMLSGAEFHDTLLQNKLISEIYNELQPEVQPQIDKRLEELEKAGESAVQEGELIDVEIDNTTSYIEFSGNSKVEVAKILRELGSNILKMGNNAVEIRREEGGARNYVDVSDGSSVVLEFPTSLGKLNIVLYQDVKNCSQVQLKGREKEMWAELQKRGEEIGKNCLFGGVKLKKVVERGNFTRCGIWSEKQKEVSEKLFSWADKVRENSKETCRAL